jgi:hypothetical protein
MVQGGGPEGAGGAGLDKIEEILKKKIAFIDS